MPYVALVHRAVLGAVFTISLAACASDEAPAASGSEGSSSESSSGEPEPGTSEVGTDTSTEGSGESESGEPEPEPLGCGELVDCLTGCVMDLGLDCLSECGTNADPEELDEAGALLACIGGVCVDKGECDFADQFDQTSCIACIGLGLFLPEPPGCEAEAAICNGEEPPPGDGDGDGDGDPTTTGDGDGDPTTSGDGDGDPTTGGDGDGDPTTGGDGDGDLTTGDGG